MALRKLRDACDFGMNLPIRPRWVVVWQGGDVGELPGHIWTQEKYNFGPGGRISYENDASDPPRQPT